MNPKDIEAQALAELDAEAFRKAVDARKVVIKDLRSRSLWARFVAWLPFTIVWKD